MSDNRGQRVSERKRGSTASGSDRRKKKWTKKRIRRYARAYFFRLIFVLGILLIVFLLFTGIRAVVRRFSGNEAAASVRGNSEQIETTEEPTTVHVPVVQTLTLSATGDCSLGKTQTQDYDGSFVQYYDAYGADYFFENVRSVFEADDFTLLNLEGTLTESGDEVTKTFNIKGAPEYVNIMTGSSVEGVTLGNNHTGDYGEQGLQDTKDTLDAAGIQWALDEDLLVYTSDEGVTVGVISKLIVTMTEERKQLLLEGIEELKSQGVDIIVAACHWGTEKEYYPSDEQVELAHQLIDAGADLIIGNHPHVLEGIEVYNGKVICYSLGNFCFGGNRNPSDKNTVIYQQTFTLIDGELQPELDARVIPCKISSANSYNDFQPTIAQDSKQNIIDNMNNYSSAIGDVTVDSEGIIHSESVENVNTQEGAVDESDEESADESSEGSTEESAE